MLLNVLQRHRKRFSKFFLIGAFTFVLGFALLYVFVSWLHINTYVSYLAQGLISIEVNYLLNRRFTWRDSKVGWWTSWSKWHVNKLVTVPLNQGIYILLVHGGMEYLLANLVTAAIFRVINYLSGHLWAFKAKRAVEPQQTVPPLELSCTYPKVSVVVPVKNSQKTILHLIA